MIKLKTILFEINLVNPNNVTPKLVNDLDTQILRNIDEKNYIKYEKCYSDLGLKMSDYVNEYNFLTLPKNTLFKLYKNLLMLQKYLKK